MSCDDAESPQSLDMVEAGCVSTAHSMRSGAALAAIRAIYQYVRIHAAEPPCDLPTPQK
jgi:hypothetical protein